MLWYPAGEAVPHVRLKAIESPMTGEATGQGIVGVNLWRGIVSQDYRADPGLLALLVDQVQHEAFL